MLFDDGDPSPAPLVGIARLAAQSELLESKTRVQYLELETRRFIGRASGVKMRFIWTVNPYRGCEFGCRYCYARYAHEFMELRDPLEFERKIFAKRFHAAAFRAELSRVKGAESIWIGTATDPYQPAERRFRITRRMLEVLAGERGRKIGITTKSDLVAQDTAWLARITRANIVQVNLTITTLDEKLARLLEPLAPRPALRLAAVRTLSKAGIRTAVLAHPILPLINDSDAGLESLAAAASEAGASSFSAAPLFLKPCAQRVFFPFLEEHFPHLVRRYRERYEKSAYLKGHYPEALSARIEKLVAQYGFAPRDAEELPAEWPVDPQMGLFG